MKNKIYATLIIALTTIISNGQTPQWNWANSAGSLFGDGGNCIATDASGNSYVIGDFEGPDITFGGITLSSIGATDVYLIKYNSFGNVIWARDIGGYDHDFGLGISLDASGNCYITGTFYSSSILFGATLLTNVDNSGLTTDFFIAKYDASGNLFWAKSVGGSEDDWGFSIASDLYGNSYTLGYFTSPSINFGGNILINAGGGFGNTDIFLTKYNSSGNVVWATSIGGTGSESGYGIAVDTNGNSFITGSFNSASISFDSISLINTNPDSLDIFIAKYDYNGNALWAKDAGGNSDDWGYSVCADKFGNCFLEGIFNSQSISFGNVTLTNAGSGTNDFFIVKFDSVGNSIWAKRGGGIDNDECYGICNDLIGNVYVSGCFASQSLNMSGTTLTNTNPGFRDILVLKYETSGNQLWAISAGGSDDESAVSISTDATGKSYITGYFVSPSIAFGGYTIINSNPGDHFVACIDTGGNPNCSAYFTLYQDTIPHNWIAINQANGTLPVSYLWSWGDGNTASGATPTHTYNSPGYYNICLTITDANSCTNNYCDSSIYVYKNSSGASMINISVIQPIGTGINAPDFNDPYFNVFPNPCNGRFNISNNAIIDEIIITDLAEKVILHSYPSEKKVVLILEKKGFYFVKIISGNKVSVKKVICLPE